MSENSPDDIFKLVKDENIEYVDVRFCDLPGTMQHFTIPIYVFDQTVFEEGLAFDGSSIRGFQSIHESDMLLLPDPETATIDPFRAAKTLNVNFSVHDPFTLELYSRDPRNVARKAENYLISSGIADAAYFGPEAEFYIFDSVKFDSNINGSFYKVDATSGWWNTGEETESDGSPNLGYKVRPKGGYFPIAPTDHYVDLRDEMLTNLTNAGFVLEKGHHEVGSGGQAEINYKFNTLLHAADDHQMYKYIVKQTAWQAGKTVTFMPKPLFGDNGSGMHCHQSLWKDGVPLMYDETGYAGLSDIARHYIGGLLYHAPSLLAFTNPTVNSYKRLVPGYRGPDQPGLQPAQPVGVRAHPDHRQQPEGQAAGVPLSRLVGQPLPGVLGHADGRAGRHQEQDRAASPGRQGPLRAAAGRGRGNRAGSDPAVRGDRPSGGRQRIPHRGRRFHARPDRDVDQLQARLRDCAVQPPADPVRVRALLRRVSRLTR